MKRTTLNGNSVDNNLFTGAEFYGSIGTLLGVVENDGYFYAVIEDNNGNLVSKNVVIETQVEMTKNGPFVTEYMYVGKNNTPIPETLAERIKEGYAKHQNLDFLYNGEVNVDLALSQMNNSVFVGDDAFIDHLRNLKKAHPSTSLNDLLRNNPFVNEEQRSNHM